MTSKTISLPLAPWATLPGQFPDFPPRDDMKNSLYLDKPAHQAALSRHFGAPDTTIVLSEIPVGWRTSQRQGLRVPDLLVAFNVDCAVAWEQNGYSIERQGKPPDFVLEIASPSTGRNDYTWKRLDYAFYGIPEYWRFDDSGGRHHDRALAGDQLVGRAYRPITIHQTDATHYWGHSTVVDLDVCWEDGQLRWWDPAARRYLRTFDEEADGRLAAEAGWDAERLARLAAEAGREAERQARLGAQNERDAATERLRAIEAEIRRLQGG